MKKLISIILITIMALSPSTLIAYAEETETMELQARLISSGRLIPATMNMTSAIETAAIRSTLYDVILDGLSNLEPRIYVGDFDLSLEHDGDREYVINTYNSVVNSTPCLFYIYERFTVEYQQSDGHVTHIVPEYMDNVAERKELFQRKTTEILSRIIRPEMSDEAKTLAVHDYLVRHAEYNNGTKTMDDYTAYGVIVNGLGVCQSYSLAYNYLLTVVGVPTKFCASEYQYDDAGNFLGGMNHGWSLVQLNGKWYHVDVTWDDPDWGSEEENSQGYVVHDYYLYSDETFLAKGHYDWITDVECTDKIYEANTPFRDDEDWVYYNAYGKKRTGCIPMYQFKYNLNDGMFYSVLYPKKNNDYFKSKFDGSDFKFITKEEYDKAVTPPDGLSAYHAINITNHRATYTHVNNINNSFIAFENTTTTDKSGTMIIALYNDKNALVECKTQDIYIPAKQVFSIRISPIDATGATRGKIFVWNDATLTEVTNNVMEF